MERTTHLGLIALLALSGLAPSPVTAQPCLIDYELTASPLPIDGQYQCGQTVTFCLTISNWNTTSANWLHGVVPSLGPGWDASTLTATTISPTQGGSGGTWGWFAVNTGTSGTAIGPVGPGFFFDLNNDGISGNNFGDFVNGPCNFQFCWSVSVASGPACVNGLDLSMTANVYGDSETGSWGSTGCTGDIDPLLTATIQACQVDAGLPGATVVCEDHAPFDLFALLGGTPDAGGVWIAPNGSVTTAIVDPAVGPAGVYTYTVFDAIPTCPSASATVDVTISKNVDAGLPNDSVLCEDAAPLNMFDALNGSPTPGGTWTAPNGTPWGGMYLAAMDPPGIYTYTVTPDAPCLQKISTLTLAVDPAPWAGDDASLTRCINNGPVELFPLLAGSPDTDGIWLDPSLSPHDGTLNPPTALSGPYAYIVRGSGACKHLIDTALVATTINPLPRIAFTAEPDSGCHPLEVTLTNTTPLEDVGEPCTWTFGDGLQGVGCTEVIHLYEESGSYHVRLKVTTPLGCTDELLVNDFIQVDPAPQATFRISPDPGTPGNSDIFFTAEDQIPVHFGWTIDGVHYADGPETHRWYNTALGSEHIVCLDVQDQYGCADTLCKPFSIVVPSIFIENAFTPDGDGLNDKFLPHLLDVVPAEHVFQVFDRWGGVIFDTNDPLEGWDGRANGDGDILPQGVYVWRLEALPAYQADKVEYIGSVVLIK